MDIATFNALPLAQAQSALQPCATVPRWIDLLVLGRPYADRDDLLTAADVAARTWSPAEVDAALSQHPRIGERREGSEAEAAMSRAEQGRILDDHAAIAAGNRAYEARFDRIFLIRAAGRTSADVLEQLTARLEHDDLTEAAVVADELRQIALLRLAGVVSA